MRMKLQHISADVLTPQSKLTPEQAPRQAERSLECALNELLALECFSRAQPWSSSMMNPLQEMAKEQPKSLNQLVALRGLIATEVFRGKLVDQAETCQNEDDMIDGETDSSFLISPSTSRPQHQGGSLLLWPYRQIKLGLHASLNARS